MFWLNIAYKIIKVFKDGASPGQAAAGLMFGFLMGFTPGWPLQVFILLLVILILNINITMAGLGLILGGVILNIFNSAFDYSGWFVLTEISQLKDIFTTMYNSPFWMLTRFNNTLVMGGFVIGLSSAVPIFFVFRTFIAVVQTRVVPRFQKSKLAALIRKSWIYGIYSKIQAVGSRI